MRLSAKQLYRGSIPRSTSTLKSSDAWLMSTHGNMLRIGHERSDVKRWAQTNRPADMHAKRSLLDESRICGGEEFR